MILAQNFDLLGALDSENTVYRGKLSITCLCQHSYCLSLMTYSCKVVLIILKTTRSESDALIQLKYWR